MATEINIQESVFLKKGEKEENALTSESFEEKVTELSGNIMKQLETNSLMAETVNTPLETGKPTSESETFFQALSVPMVVADEHNNEPESFKAAKQTETEEKAEDEVRSEVFDSVAPAKKDDVSVLEKNEGDSDGVTSSQDAVCEDIKETTTEQHASTVVDVKEQDLSREFVKEETEDKSVNSLEESEQCEIESKDIEEQKFEENVKKIEQDGEIKEIKPDVEQEKQEQNGLLQEAITSDVCISTDSKTQVENEEHDQKNEIANVLVEDKDKNDITSAQEVAVEEDLQEKSHHNEDTEHQVSEVKESIEEDNDVVKESIKNEETNDEKAIEKEVCEENGPKKAEFEEALEVSESVVPHQQETFNVLEKDKGDSDGVTSSQEAPYVAVEETTTDQHVTTVIDFKEQDMNEKPKEFIEEETKDILLDAQEASKECENGAKEEIEQNPEESVKKIEKEEETEESVTNDVFVSTQTKSQVEKPEHEEEKICEETGSEKVEYEKEVEDSTATVFNKDKIEDEDEKTEQEVSVLKKDEGEDGVTSAQEVAFEKDLQEKIHHNENDESEVVTAEESIEKDTEVCIPTQTEPEEEKTNKNDEEVIERDDDQTNKSVTPIMKEIGEENVSEKTESEEAKDKSVDVKEETEQYDDGAKGEKEQKLEESVDETTHSYSENEEEEHAEEIKPSDETIEEKEVGISTQIESLEDASKNEENDIVTDDLKKTESEEIQVSKSSNVKTRESVDADTEEEVKQSDNFGTTLNENEIMTKEETLTKEEEIKASEVQGVGDDITSSQSASNEDLKETTIGHNDTTVTYVEEVQGVSATPKEILIEEADYKSIDAQEISLEHGQPNETSEVEIEKDEKDLSKESVKDTNDDATKEEKDTLLEQEIVEEQSVQDDGLKEKVIDLNETTETEPQEDVTSSTSLETSTKDTLNSEKEQEESENFPIKGLETVSDVKIPELVSKSEDSMPKEDCTVSETETHLDEEKETVTKEILSDEKTKVQGDGDDVTSSHNTSNEYIQETTTDQHDTTIAEGVSASSKEILIEEPEHKSVDAEEILLESVQSNEQNDEETQSLSKTLSQNPEAEINKEDNDLSREIVEDTKDNTIKEEIRALEHESVEEHNGLDEVSKEEITYLNETTEVKVQEDITPSSSLEASTKDASNSEKEKAESENLPIEELETVFEVKIPETVPKSEESVLKEESYVSEKGTQLDEEKRTVTEEISSDEKTEPITEINQEVVKEICEETNLEKAEFEEPKLYDSSSVKINEDLQDIEEIKSSVETEEITETYENEEKISEKAIENDDNETVTEKENLEKKQDDVEETKMGEHDTTTKDAISKEEEEIERYGDVSNDEKDQKPEEHIDEIITSVETNEEKDVSISTHIESQEDATKDEEQAIENDGDQKEKLDDDPFVKEACEENDVKKIESEEERQIPNSDNVRTRESVVEDIEEPKYNDDTKENTDQQGLLHETNETLSKEEKLEEEHEIKTSEVQGGVDDVTSAHNASNLDIQETTIDQHDTIIAHVEQGQDVNAMPKEILIEEAENKSIDSEEISLELEQPDKQNPEEEIKKQDKDLSLESVENTDKEEESTLKQEPVEEHSGIDEVSKEKAIDINETTEVEPQEDITPSNLVEKSTEDTSNIESVLKEEFISKTETHLDEEKEIETKETSSDENKEQTTELKQETVCEETSSEKAEFEEGLKLSDNSDIKIDEEVISTFKDGEKEKDQEVKVLGANQGEDNIPEEKEDLQEKNYHYESNEREFLKSTKAVDEDTEDIKSSVEIENTEHVITTNVVNLTQTESGEESKENEENDGEKAIECDQTEIVSRDKNIETKQEDDGQIYLEKQEKEQESTISELQGDVDDVISLKNAVNEDTKETEIGQHATTSVPYEEEVGVNAVTKDVTGEEIEVKVVQAPEASEQCDSGTNDTTEQQPEETVNEPVNFGSETIKESIQEEEDAGIKKTETTLEAENQADRTEDRSEMKDEVIMTENVSKDLGELEEQNVEEIQECIKETISEKTEDEITKKEEDLSHDSVTKEEKFLPDGITKNIEISTLEHEPVEEKNNSQNVTQESQLNITEYCSKKVKDVILTKEIEQVPLEIEKEKGITDFKEQIVKEDSYSPELEVKPAQNQEEILHEISNSDSIPVEKPEVTEVNVDAQEALQGKEEISCESKVNNDRVDQEPTEEIISSQVDLTNIESTAYPSESEKLTTRAFESDCDVQTHEVVADSEDSKVKEECNVLETTGNNVEEQDIQTKDISSTPETDHENVTNAPVKSDEAKSSDLIIEENAIINENLEVHEELGPTSEPVTEDQVTIEEKPQPEQSDITSESVKNDPTLESKLEHTSEKDSDAKEDIEEDVTLAPENEIKSKNIILTEEVEYSKPIPVENTEVTEVKAESQIEVENIHAEEDLSDLSKESSIIETSKVEMYEDTKKTIIAEVKDDNIYEASKDNTVPVLEDSKASGNEKMEDAIINEIERSSSRPDELLETQNSVEDAKDPKFISDNLNVKDETFIETKGPNEDSEIKTEVAEIVPECKEASVTNVKNTEDPEVVPSVEKDVTVDVQKNEKDIDHETKVKTADVSSNVESSEIEPSREEETFEFINQQKQREHKEADVSIEAVNPVEDVKTSTREFEFRSVDFEVPTVTDATANKADNKTVEVHEAEKELLKDNEHLESKCDQSKPVEEDSKMKQQPLQLDAPETLDIATTKDLKISQKNVTDDILHEPAKEDSKVSENLIGEKDSSLTKDLQVEKEETGESGVKTDEEGHEEEDNEDDEKMGSGSDAPVMVEASKDIDVKVHKKSHNILSGVGSKVKHSIAKVKKAITGKSSPQKSPSPKASNQVVD